jgi:hypothetical protein
VPAPLLQGHGVRAAFRTAALPARSAVRKEESTGLCADEAPGEARLARRPPGAPGSDLCPGGYSARCGHARPVPGPSRLSMGGGQEGRFSGRIGVSSDAEYLMPQL